MCQVLFESLFRTHLCCEIRTQMELIARCPSHRRSTSASWRGRSRKRSCARAPRGPENTPGIRLLPCPVLPCPACPACPALPSPLPGCVWAGLCFLPGRTPVPQTFGDAATRKQSQHGEVGNDLIKWFLFNFPQNRETGWLVWTQVHIFANLLMLSPQKSISKSFLRCLQVLAKNLTKPHLQSTSVRKQ